MNLLNMLRFLGDLYLRAEDNFFRWVSGPLLEPVDPDSSKWLRYWFVETGNDRQIGDIKEITEHGHIKSVKRLAFGLVEVTFDNNDVHTIHDAFVTKEEAEHYASSVLDKEIERLVRKRNQLAGAIL